MRLYAIGLVYYFHGIFLIRQNNKLYQKLDQLHITAFTIFQMKTVYSLCAISLVLDKKLQREIHALDTNGIISVII